ncbi:MAG: iron-containing alcohol dehydrogenase, partial [Candidatus Bathyarchaeota archaeon]
MSEMIHNFPPAIHFGWGEAKGTAKHVRNLGGAMVLIVTDEGVRKAGLLKGVQASLKKEEIPFMFFDGVQPNPTDLNVMEGLEIYRSEGCNAVVAVGGGSPMDAAKGVVLMARHPGRLEEYYVGADPRSRITGDVPSFIAIPTTSGTGSEASTRGVITNTAENRKRVII